MALETFVLGYQTDNNENVFIKIRYDSDSILTPAQRLSRGGFSATTVFEDGYGCFFTFSRKDLMPRYIDIMSTGTGFGGTPKKVRIFYRTHDLWLQARSRVGELVSAQGEKLNCKALNFVA